MAEPIRRPSRLQRLRRALAAGALQRVQRLLRALRPAEIADLLESLPSRQRQLVWELVDPASDGEVLVYVNDEVRDDLLRDMDAAELVAATGTLDADDLADLLQHLPEAVSAGLLRSMDLQNRRRLEQVLAYPEASAGGLMNTDPITVRADVLLDVVLRYLRWRGTLPEQTDSLIVIDRHNRYLGLLPLGQLLTQDPDLTVADVMKRDVPGIPADLPAAEVANLFARRDLISAPVVDEHGLLLGRITIDDVVDVIRDEAEHSLMGMAGLDEDVDIFAPVAKSARRRATWLGINLVTAFMASWVIGLFEGTLEKVVALAVLMPVVASMGGIAGSQTLTLMVRGLALGHVEWANARLLLGKELAVALLNGLLWAAVVAIIAMAWFHSVALGAIIGVAILINLLCAALSGVGIPLLLRWLGIDPAIAGGVVLTTVTDIVGFFAFLGLATLWLI
jgi:magnesium transporter